ncbi:cation:proton antiporter [Duncaniella muris]|jgi:CPA2 family monovalent cation:H+ antiporter-2|uniref:cation:proton antiporter n=1 Tax=Duncaniella muris TaxID=2094150 RepID=UPI0025A57EB6|nr:cation:proton antiporter [Duncaniella muris]
MLLNLILANATQVTEAFNVEGLIRDLAFLLILGAVTTLLFKWLKQPVVLGYIVAGFLASPNFEYLPSVTTEDNIEFWAQLGIVVLLFSLGLEFSFKKLVNAGGSAVVTALFIVCGMMGAGFAVGHMLGFSHINSLFLGGMLSMSSTTIIIKAFTDLNLRHRKFASLVFAVLIVEDLFAVLMMVVLSSIAINSSVEGGEMLYSVSKLAFFLIIWFVVGVFALPSLLNSQRRFLNSETLLIISMGLCLGMAVFSVACGFSLALGAFVMGSILAGTSFAERIERVTIPVKDLFGSIFFISVGMMVDPAIIAHYWLPILILSAVVICGMIFFGTIGMLLTGQSLRVAIESGFSLTQIGEFAFIIASLGMSLGVLDAQIYPIVVAVSVVTTFTTPYFIRMADPTANFVEAHLPRRLHFLINRYTEEATTSASATRQLWHSLFKRYLWRVVLYSIVLIAMSLISLDYIVPTFTGLFPNWGRLFATVVSLLFMAPFLLAMTYPASKKTERERLIAANARYDVPLIVMTIVRLLIAMTILVYLLSSIYSMKVGWTIGVGLFFILVLSFSKSAHKRMVRIESRFIDNLNERELRRSGAKNRLVPNMHLAYMTVGYKCPFVGEQLKNSGLRSRFGVSVASIQRGGDLIMVPGAEERVFPGDVLGVIGTDDEIQKLLPVVEVADDEAPEVSADDIRLTGVRLKASSPLIGKTIVSSNFRNVWESLLVSVQRDGDYLQPDPSIVFSEGDTIWAVGSVKRLADIEG